MRLLGIDYGSKRVGVASTDDTGSFALPRTVLMASSRLAQDIGELADTYGAARIVVGESKDLDGKLNPIMADVMRLVEELKAMGRDVALHPEVYSSMEAERLQGSNEMNDASAAAIILKSYIDTQAHYDNNR